MTVRPQRHASPIKQPFSRRIDTKTVSTEPVERSVEASSAECEAIAAATDLPALHALSARYTLRRRAGGRIALAGDIVARVAERCVVSLELFDGDISQPVDLMFAPAISPVAPRGRRSRSDRPERDEEVAVIFSSGPGNDDQADPPDPMVDDIIDLGVVTVEFLSLARDPYPRKPDAAFDDVVADADEAPPSPFAALASLKDPS